MGWGPVKSVVSSLKSSTIRKAVSALTGPLWQSSAKAAFELKKTQIRTWTTTGKDSNSSKQCTLEQSSMLQTSISPLLVPITTHWSHVVMECAEL